MSQWKPRTRRVISINYDGSGAAGGVFSDEASAEQYLLDYVNRDSLFRHERGLESVVADVADAIELLEMAHDDTASNWSYDDFYTTMNPVYVDVTRAIIGAEEG